MDVTAPPRFLFPILKWKEIVECMMEITDVELTKQELQEPQRHRDKLRHMFAMVLESCVGKGEETFANPPSEFMLYAQEHFPDVASLHDAKTFGDVYFFLSLRRLMETCGYDSFSFKDLHTPTSKRLRDQLSAVINFCKFREDQLLVYQQLQEVRDEHFAALEEVNKENADLVATLEQTEQVSQQKYIEMEQVLSECNELEMEIAKNNKLQAQAREAAEGLKKKAHQLKDELDTAHWALQEMAAEEEQLRAQVVSSPDRRKQQLEVKKSQLDQERVVCEQLQNELDACQRKTDNLQHAQRDLCAAKELLLELTDLAHKYKEAVRTLEDTLQEIQANGDRLAVTQTETDDANRELHRAEDKMIHQRKQHTLQLEATQEALETARQLLLNVEKDRRDAMARVDQSEAEVRALEAAMEEERLKTSQEIHELMEEFHKTEQVFLERNSARLQAIGV